MKISHRRIPIVATCCLLGGGPMGSGVLAAPAGGDANACERAGVAAEQASGLPAGVLLAIGQVESGRWDSERGRVTAWPWTINAAGKGQWFESKQAAVASVASLREGGTRSIDVGCFQISLLWHPTAFDSLDQAFDPDANARYAAAFLLSLFSRTGSWSAAVEAYHSADPLLGFAYRRQVYASWLTVAQVTAPVRVGPVPTRAPVAMPLVYAGVSVWTPVPPETAGEVVAMPGAPVLETARAPDQALPTVSYHMPKGIMPHR
jgi:hypothetical protein